MRLPQRHRDGRHPEQRGLERARNGPRIGHIVAKVPTLVDAGDDEIGQALEHVRDRDVDAVGRRTVDAENALVDSIEAQHVTQRQRVANRARFGRRRDDGDVADVAQRAGERMNAFRSVAIVVGDQDANHAATIIAA